MSFSIGVFRVSLMIVLLYAVIKFQTSVTPESLQKFINALNATPVQKHSATARN